MITLKNQLVLQFTLGQFTDFIDIKNFMGMEIIEHAGGLRPIPQHYYKFIFFIN